MRSSSWIAHVAQLPTCKFKVTRNPLTATFTYPGFNYSNFSRDGIIDIMSVMSCVDDTLTLAQHYPYKGDEDKWIDWEEVCRDHMTFFSSLQIVMSRNMYNKSVPLWSLDAKVLLGNVGKSTVSFVVELYVPGSREPLLTEVLQIVGVDKETRKPYPFPDWFRDQYKSQCSMKSGFRLEPFSRPEDTFVYKREVTWLETDRNDHTNFISYVRYAVDGLHSALRHLSEDKTAGSTSLHQDSKMENLHPSQPTNDVSSASNHIVSSDDFSEDSSVELSEDASGRNDGLHALPATATEKSSSRGALKGISKDIMKAGVKSLRVCFVSECMEGDLVDVHLWQEENEKFIVKCSVEKGTQLICQIVLEYFSPLVAKL